MTSTPEPEPFVLTPPEPRHDKPGRRPMGPAILPDWFPIGRRFSSSPAAVARRRRAAWRLGKLRDLFGIGPAGAKCRTCANLTRRGNWFKCAKYRASASDATDWRAHWPACGAYEKRETKL